VLISTQTTAVFAAVGLGLAIAVLTTTSLARADDDDCRVSSGASCEVVASSSSGGVVSFVVTLSGFSRAGLEHTLVYIQAGGGELTIQVPPGLTEGGCQATASDPGCDATCGCAGDHCACHAWTDMVWCEHWFMLPDGTWDVWGEGEAC
jgi:hypothetical protein